MAWLERLNHHTDRRLSRSLRRGAIEAGQLARAHLQDFARETGAIAARAAHDVADYSRGEGAELVRERASQYADFALDRAQKAQERARRYAHAAGEVAGQLANTARQEGAIIADAAATQALRVGRAVKSDPVPLIVGAIGVALFANLLFGRRR